MPLFDITERQIAVITKADSKKDRLPIMKITISFSFGNFFMADCSNC